MYDIVLTSANIIVAIALYETQDNGVSIYWFDKMQVRNFQQLHVICSQYVCISYMHFAVAQDIVDILLGSDIDDNFRTMRPKRKRTN